jgi:acyl dehydratase
MTSRRLANLLPILAVLGSVTALGIDYARVLHGEQHFVYHHPVFAGDTLSFSPVITDLYDKKDGALEFVAWETRVEAQDGKHVADLRSVMVVRHEKAARAS